MTSYAGITVAISLMSVIANILLLFVFFRCSLKATRGFKYYFFFTAVQDLVYSLCFLVHIPEVVTREFTYMFIATGPLRASPYGMIFLALFCLTTISSIVFVANSFLYRYIQLCKNHYLYLYSTKKFVLAGILINILFIVNWMLMIYLCLWPSSSFLNVAEKLWSGEGLEIANTCYVGITCHDGADPFKMTLLIESLILLFTIATISPCCAMKIHRNLKENSLSEHTKRLHRQMLKLLLIQTGCPALFMHAPICSMYVLFFTGVTSPPAMTYIFGILIASLPLSVPISILVCVKEYRDFFISKWTSTVNKTAIAPGLIVTATMWR